MGQRGLGFLGQEETAQAAARIGQRGGDGMMSIQPHRPFRRVRSWARTITLIGPRLSALPIKSGAIPPRSIGSLLKRFAALRLGCLRARAATILLSRAEGQAIG